MSRKHFVKNRSLIALDLKVVNFAITLRIREGISVKSTHWNFDIMFSQYRNILAVVFLGVLLQTWINFNPNMNK